MSNEKMTIHRGLSELKLIDSRIEKQIKEIEPSGTLKKGGLVNGFYASDAFETNAKSKLDSIQDLLERKVKIKSAIVKANSTATVVIGVKRYTIADAINYRATINLKKQLIESLKSKHKAVMAHCTKNNDIVDSNGLALAKAALEKDNVKIGDSDVDNIMKPYVEANKFELVDPLKVEELIAKLEKEAEEFETEIDACLSEVNSTTYIEI